MKKLNGCGETGPYGYRCTHHENGEHVARGTEPGSFAEAWPIITPVNLNAEFIADATRSYVERDPRNNIGWRVLEELAAVLQVQDTDPTDSAVCENCGKPAKYDSEMILCPACDLLSCVELDRIERNRLLRIA